MSKKNKALKQLLKNQIQSNAAATLQGKDLSSQVQVSQTSQSNSTLAQPILDKQLAESILIKKDIRLSVMLSSAVIIILIAIYFIDKSNPFLLSLAEKIFSILQ